MRLASGFELTYCSNIHAADGWPHVFDSLRTHAVELKGRLSPGAPFGIGLRLSNSESIELLQPQHLEAFIRFLKERDMYVAILNGFPYGRFHETKLKDKVFAPDWHTVERVDYTLRLVEILRRVLPQELDGGVSTCPLSYKPWHHNASTLDWNVLINNVVRVAGVMSDVHARHNRLIHLDIEPEPDGLVENTREFLAFFKQLLRKGPRLLARSAQLTISQAENTLREHVRLCYDVCHFAVEGEEPGATLAALRAEDVRIGRAQISSAIKVTIPPAGPERDQLRQQLNALVDPTYLHQVIGDNQRFRDLPEGLVHLGTSPEEQWRIHYHVPLFLENYGALSSTQRNVQAALAHLTPAEARHLEIETYTWNVLPPSLKADLVDSIEREYRWVIAQLCVKP